MVLKVNFGFCSPKIYILSLISKTLLFQTFLLYLMCSNFVLCLDFYNQVTYIWNVILNNFHKENMQIQENYTTYICGMLHTGQLVKRR